FVTSNIIGATTLDQLRENLGSASVSLEDDVLAAIEDLNREYTYPCP
ncbi:MAG: aldo/keto reductase, partial [Marinobacter sp.]|nr:aldo/keto reductase [Marinobacter sp.]